MAFARLVSGYRAAKRTGVNQQVVRENALVWPRPSGACPRASSRPRRRCCAGVPQQFRSTGARPSWFSELERLRAGLDEPPESPNAWARSGRNLDRYLVGRAADAPRAAHSTMRAHRSTKPLSGRSAPGPPWPGSRYVVQGAVRRCPLRTDFLPSYMRLFMNFEHDQVDELPEIRDDLALLGTMTTGHGCRILSLLRRFAPYLEPALAADP